MLDKQGDVHISDKSWENKNNSFRNPLEESIMYIYEKTKKIGVLSFLFFCWFGLGMAPLHVFAADPLYQKIEAVKKSYEQPAENAKIDKVWKKIPGKSGRTVNVKKSYQAMKKQAKFQENLLVFDTIKPEIGLNDLPPELIYRGNPNKQMVALSINVAWGEEYIPQMLDILDQRGVKATFYIEGRFAKANPKVVQQIAKSGHEIGNHSYTHADFASISEEQAKMELKKTNAILTRLTKQRIQRFAPPSGAFGAQTAAIASEMGMYTVLWTMDTIDWQNPSPSTVMQRILKKMHPGGIILMHPTKASTYALDLMIETLQGKGYTVGTVGSLLEIYS